MSIAVGGVVRSDIHDPGAIGGELSSTLFVGSAFGGIVVDVSKSDDPLVLIESKGSMGSSNILAWSRVDLSPRFVVEVEEPGVLVLMSRAGGFSIATVQNELIVS